jgi:hypothetical protein
VICAPCRRAGRALAIGEAEIAVHLHSECLAPLSCGCQHVTATTYQNQEVGNADPEFSQG